MKQEFLDRVNREMAQDLKAPALPPREALAAACRILAAEGHESGLAGQVTARAEEPGTWWTLEFGYGFDEATPGRMVLVDEDLRPLSGGRPNPGVRFHVWIYRQRPEVQAIVHTHAPHASALAATGKPLKTIHMDSAMLHGTAHLPEWPGVPVADDEGRIISGALGDAKTILLANHGLLATGTYVEEAAYLAVFFERAARMQLRAMAAGGFKEVRPELAEEACRFLLQPSIVKATLAYWNRSAAARNPK
ncbi:MAG: class aldolase/adducin domain protein [Burkholderiales bacterium]|jgi:L-fuculose-phosphate aldolase|nr:class aldolase/adducin domain protein [Burkholderiales bacterium]